MQQLDRNRCGGGHVGLEEAVNGAAEGAQKDAHTGDYDVVMQCIRTYGPTKSTLFERLEM